MVRSAVPVEHFVCRFMHAQKSGSFVLIKRQDKATSVGAMGARALGHTLQPLKPNVPNRFTTSVNEWVAL